MPQLLGFARATSDGALSAVIWDVSVAPAWQRGGLGRALIERLTASLVNDGIATITLYAGGCPCLAWRLMVPAHVGGTAATAPGQCDAPPRCACPGASREAGGCRPLPRVTPAVSAAPFPTRLAEPNVVALYQKLGFVADPDGVRGVAYQRTKAARGLAGGLLGRR